MKRRFIEIGREHRKQEALDIIYNDGLKSPSIRNLVQRIAIKKWNERILVEYVSMLYMGLLISLNIEKVHNGGQFHEENFCYRMTQPMLKLLQTNFFKHNASNYLLIC